MRPIFVLILIAGCGGDPAPQMMMQESPDFSDTSVDLAMSKPDMAKPVCVSSGCGAATCGAVVDNCGDTIQCGGCNADSVCSSNRCVPHCGNGVKDGDESDVDCGGATCGKCALDKGCAGQSDCAAGTCDSNVCRAGTFTALADMPTGRSDAAVALGPDGKIWVLGGMVGSSAVTKVEVYDPTKDSWSSATSMGTARAHFGAAFGNDGKLYVAGGPEAPNASAGASQTAEVYDSVSKMWTALPSLSVGRTGLRLAKDATGRLIAFGGYAYINYYQTEAESPESFTAGDSAWKPVTMTLVGARDGFGLTTMADGSFLLAGGEHFVNNPGYDPMCTGLCTPKQNHDEVDGVEVCDLANGCSQVASFSGDTQFGQRNLVAARTDDGTVYLFGDDQGPTTGWKLSGSKLSPIASGGLYAANGAAVSGGKIYVVDTKHLYLFTP
jgi:hypothetical protein